MEDPRIISALFIFLKMAYYNVLINTVITLKTGLEEDVELEHEDYLAAACFPILLFVIF